MENPKISQLLNVLYSKYNSSFRIFGFALIVGLTECGQALKKMPDALEEDIFNTTKPEDITKEQRQFAEAMFDALSDLSMVFCDAIPVLPPEIALISCKKFENTMQAFLHYSKQLGNSIRQRA